MALLGLGNVQDVMLNPKIRTIYFKNLYHIPRNYEAVLFQLEIPSANFEQ